MEMDIKNDDAFTTFIKSQFRFWSSPHLCVVYVLLVDTHRAISLHNFRCIGVAYNFETENYNYKRSFLTSACPMIA